MPPFSFSSWIWPFKKKKNKTQKPKHLTITSDVITPRCHICTVVEETNVPNLPPSTLPSRSYPIAGYCLHLSPVLSVLEVIGSPSRCFFFFFFFGGGRSPSARLRRCSSQAWWRRLLARRRTYLLIICYLWLNILDYWFTARMCFSSFLFFFPS